MLELTTLSGCHVCEGTWTSIYQQRDTPIQTGSSRISQPTRRPNQKSHSQIHGAELPDCRGKLSFNTQLCFQKWRANESYIFS
jgi:hypothetical protein